jgi:hypothetical protein
VTAKVQRRPKPTNAAVFTADKPSSNATTLDVVAGILGDVIVVVGPPRRFASVKCAVKRLDLSRPELKVAGAGITVTREGNLGGSTGEHI